MKLSATGKEIVNCVIAFTILAVVSIGYMSWYGAKTMEASLEQTQ